MPRSRGIVVGGPGGPSDSAASPGRPAAPTQPNHPSAPETSPARCGASTSRAPCKRLRHRHRRPSPEPTDRRAGHCRTAAIEWQAPLPQLSLPFVPCIPSRPASTCSRLAGPPAGRTPSAGSAGITTSVSAPPLRESAGGGSCAAGQDRMGRRLCGSQRTVRLAEGAREFPAGQEHAPTSP